MEELRALIGLKMCEGIGDISAYKLLLHYGSASAVFDEKRQHLSSISGISPNISGLLDTGIDWGAVEKEVRFIEEKHINYITILDKNYPKLLLTIDSPPIILFFKGCIERLSTSPCISIVGTRNATNYGLDAVSEIISSLKNVDINIISGLAHGIDIFAHKECIKNDIPTFGIVGHGIKTMYPSIHAPYANEMTEKGGGVITEFFSDMIPNRENFPKRNRIIAGLSYATIVIEASKKSGTLITAELALGYHRKVFALPGRYSDKYSEGCNFLLKNRSVKPILSITSLFEELGFKKKVSTQKPAASVNLSHEENTIIQLITAKSKVGLDSISANTSISISSCSALLFNLELLGLVRSLPGKMYELY